MNEKQKQQLAQQIAQSSRLYPEQGLQIINSSSRENLDQGTVRMKGHTRKGQHFEILAQVGEGRPLLLSIRKATN